MNNPERCQAQIRTGQFMLHWRRCTRKAYSEDGYCRQHHPAAVEQRREKSAEAAKKRFERDPLRQYMNRYVDLLNVLRDLQPHLKASVPKYLRDKIKEYLK